MTIVVGAASPDGLVLAADSRTTMIDGSRHRIATDAADKIFALNKAFGVATYGEAFIGARTISGLMDEFVATVDKDQCNDVGKLARDLGDFFHERFVAEYGEIDTSAGWPLGFIVAGYDDSGIGRMWEVGVPGPTVGMTQVETATQGVLWRGQVDVIGRLIQGVDWYALATAEIEFEKPINDTLSQLQYVLQTPITLQDAVDMASFLVRTTIDMQRFSDGTALAPGLIPGCGGRTQMLAVTRAGVEWVDRRLLSAPTRPGWAEGSTEL